MRKFVVVLVLLALLGLVLACMPDYKALLEKQVESDNVTPITLEQADGVQANEPIVTFVIGDASISADSVVYISRFRKGAEADAVYMIRNECAVSITPVIYFAKGRIDDYSAVEGQGYKDAPSFVEGWVHISPTPFPIPPDSAQGFIVSLVMPKDADDVPSKFAFQVGVAVGDRVQLAVAPWWLVSMR